VFVKERIREDFAEICGDEAAIESVAETLKITRLLDKHPYDLSGGEQQKCALAKILLLNPEILLLDEPTKGIDSFAKKTLTRILKTLQLQGITTVIVSHDAEFACVTADRCALLFDGEILPPETPNNFFSENNFYTTSASRIARSMYKNAVTCEEVVELCKQNVRL
jgi:energy-coupling factor transport system ATP-binding protein